MNKRYEFTYKNGVVQQKILISHKDWEKWRAMPENTKEQEKTKAKYWKEVTNDEEWFTDQSSLYEAISTGVLNCNGQFLIQAKLVDYE